MNVIREGGHGDQVRDVQRRLLGAGLRIDPGELEGTFGPSTVEAVRAFQRLRGLPADGIVGGDTWGQLVEAGYRLGDRTLYLRSPAFRGDDVRELQRRLNALGFDAGKEDGIYGRGTARGVHEFQRNVGDKVDGIVGLDTVRALERVRPATEGPSRAIVREEEAARRMAAALSGSVVAIDPGHAPSDPGHLIGDITEAELSLRIATALADELGSRGARPLVLRKDGQDPTTADRIRHANANEALLCVSLHTGDGDRVPSGAACFYYGTPSTHSPMGLRLATCIRDALVEETGSTDGGVHPLAIAILRETRMPAVQVEPGVATNPLDAADMTDPGFPPKVASAIADGIERFLGGIGNVRSAGTA